MQVCYCSVYDPCWTAETDSGDAPPPAPREVSACPAPGKDLFVD